MPLALDRFPVEPVADYQTLRPMLENGDILLASGTGTFSTLIQRATESVWSHTAFVLRLHAIDRIMLLESVEPIGVRTIRLSKYLHDYNNHGGAYPGGLAIIRHRQFKTTIDDAKLSALARFAIDQFGYPYDVNDIARIAARILASRVRSAAAHLAPLAPNREFICSEYVARCYETAGLAVQWNRLGFIAPSDFAADPNFDLIAVLKAR